MKKAIALLVLVACTLMCLVSCAPSTPDAASKKLEANDYYVMVADASNGEVEDAMDMFELDADGVSAVVCGSADEGGPDDSLEFVYVIFCEDSKAADRVEADCEEFLEEQMSEILEYFPEEDFKIEDFCVLKKGKIVLFGHKKAVAVVS